MTIFTQIQFPRIVRLLGESASDSWPQPLPMPARSVALTFRPSPGRRARRRIYWLGPSRIWHRRLLRSLSNADPPVPLHVRAAAWLHEALPPVSHAHRGAAFTASRASRLVPALAALTSAIWLRVLRLGRMGTGIADTSVATLVARSSSGSEERSQNLALIASTRAAARIVTPLVSGTLFARSCSWRCAHLETSPRVYHRPNLHSHPIVALLCSQACAWRLAVPGQRCAGLVLGAAPAAAQTYGAKAAASAPSRRAATTRGGLRHGCRPVERG